MHPTASFADPDATTGVEASPNSSAPPASPPLTDRYILCEEIARGGMGEVYLATDAALGREVAVKVLQAQYAPESLTARRFHDEARITAQLQHPGVPPVHDLGTLPDGRPFLAMKLIKGSTLDDELKARPDPSADRGRWVAAFEQVCHTLAYAHAHGVIHRDVKPQNVMVGGFGEVQVMDWGLAKVLSAADHQSETDPQATGSLPPVQSLRDSDDLLTQAGSILGTPAYMAPEQAAGAVSKVDARSDVFGLGGLLSAILSGMPPFSSGSAETTRVMAAQGDLVECFSRLDSSGADPELVALCKRCLSPKREDRPADAGEVAKAVTALRQAADERARQAELERVKAEGVVAAAAVASAERRKRRRVWLGAITGLVVVVVSGLIAVLAIQRQANADLNVKNQALADEQAKVEQRNIELEAERAKVEKRFDMARKAIAAFHTTIDEQPELGNEAFRPLRKKLLTSASQFYRELEGLLAGESDPKSRASLAEGLEQLGDLTDKIGDQREALTVYRRALAIRRELLAGEEGPNPQQAMRGTLMRVASALNATDDTPGAMQAYEEALGLAEGLAAADPRDSKLQENLANSHIGLGNLLIRTGKREQGLKECGKGQAIFQKLADGDPSHRGYQTAPADSICASANWLFDSRRWEEALEENAKAQQIVQKLAKAHPEDRSLQVNLAGLLIQQSSCLFRTGKKPESLTALAEARRIFQGLADANPAVTHYQTSLALCHHNAAGAYAESGALTEALEEFGKVLVIQQKLAAANPGIIQYQVDVADVHYCLGFVHGQRRTLEEAISEYGRAREIYQKLADANPRVVLHQARLAETYSKMGGALLDLGRKAEGLAAYQKALAIDQKLCDSDPNEPRHQSDLATRHNNLGLRLAKQGQFVEAFAALDAGLAIRQKLVTNYPKTSLYANYLGYSHAYRGWARVRAGRPKEAAEDLRAAVALWAKDPAPSIESLFEHARALALLAKLGRDPLSGVTADEAKRFADSSVATLADAVKARWAAPAELKEPDFDAVRDRDDFKKLLADLEAKVSAH